MTPGTQFTPRFEACGFHPEEIVARRRDLTGGQKWLYDRLVRWSRNSDGERANERSGEVWRSQANIAHELSKSSKQVARDIARLESAGLLGHRKRDGRKSNTYFFLFHPDFEQTSMSSQLGAIARFEKTPMSVQIVAKGSAGFDLNGHPRPVRSDLNGHPRPSNQEVVNQQEHTQGNSGWSDAPTKPVQCERKRASSKAPEKLGRPPSAFRSGGWESSEDFEFWWAQIVQKHPNKNRNSAAKGRAAALIQEGTLKRKEFEDGYAAFAAANAERWREASGRYAPNLLQFLDDRRWQHAEDGLPTVPVRNDGYEAAEDYLRRYGIQ